MRPTPCAKLKNRNPFINRLVADDQADEVKAAGQFAIDVEGELLLARIDALREQGHDVVAKDIHYLDGNVAIFGHTVTQVDLVGNRVGVNLYVGDYFGRLVPGERWFGDSA